MGLLKCQAGENKIRLRCRNEINRAARIISIPAGHQVGLAADEFAQFLTHDRLILDNQHARFACLLRAGIRHPGHVVVGGVGCEKAADALFSRM